MTFFANKKQLLNLRLQLLMLSFGYFTGNKWDLEDKEAFSVPKGTSSPCCIIINLRTLIE